VIAAIIVTYDGWTWAAYFNGETKGGSGAVARACIKGVVLVICLYLLLMGALAFSVPLSSLAGSELALATALEMAVSPTAATLVIGLAILILLTHQNLLYLSAPRILQALAVDGLAIRQVGVVSHSGNPLAGVIISWAITVFLILIGGFNFLLHLVTFFYVSLYMVCIAGVMILRRTRPDAERPYRAWGHPWSTVLCLVVWGLIAAYQTYSALDTALYALAMVVFAWPIYVYLKRNRA
jgi:APA family basic amino acid/polyamine antiporter